MASVPMAALAAKSLKTLSEIAAVRFPLFQIFVDAKIGGADCSPPPTQDHQYLDCCDVHSVSEMGQSTSV